jgi:hypothetical protein
MRRLLIAVQQGRVFNCSSRPLSLFELVVYFNGGAALVVVICVSGDRCCAAAILYLDLESEDLWVSMASAERRCVV